MEINLLDMNFSHVSQLFFLRLSARSSHVAQMRSVQSRLASKNVILLVRVCAMPLVTLITSLLMAEDLISKEPVPTHSPRAVGWKAPTWWPFPFRWRMCSGTR